MLCISRQLLIPKSTHVKIYMKMKRGMNLLRTLKIKSAVIIFCDVVMIFLQCSRHICNGQNQFTSLNLYCIKMSFHGTMKKSSFLQKTYFEEFRMILVLMSFYNVYNTKWFYFICRFDINKWNNSKCTWPQINTQFVRLLTFSCAVIYILFCRRHQQTRKKNLGEDEWFWMNWSLKTQMYL